MNKLVKLGRRGEAGKTGRLGGLKSRGGRGRFTRAALFAYFSYPGAQILSSAFRKISLKKTEFAPDVGRRKAEERQTRRPFSRKDGKKVSKRKSFFAAIFNVEGASRRVDFVDCEG